MTQDTPPPQMLQQFRDPQWGAQQLSQINLFKSFSLEELRGLYAKGEVISLKSNAYAVIEGEPTRGLYIILSGSMSVFKNDVSTGAMHRIAYLQTGNSFGEMSLFDQVPRSASVAAESTCHLFSLDANAFNQYMDQTGDAMKLKFYRACTDDLAQRFRKLNADYISIQQLLWAHGFTRSEVVAKEHKKVA